MSQVLFPARLSRDLYRKCRTAFPNEEYAILLGTEDRGYFEIDELYFPPARLDNMLPNKVKAKSSWFADANRLAQHLGLEVLGEIHSHCYEKTENYPGLEPSEDDWDRGDALLVLTGGEFRLMGIVRVLREGSKLACRTRFWPAICLPVTIK